jgi:tetratricopeptide (TPR) repeat protein
MCQSRRSLLAAAGPCCWLLLLLACSWLPTHVRAYAPAWPLLAALLAGCLAYCWRLLASPGWPVARPGSAAGRADTAGCLFFAPSRTPVHQSSCGGVVIMRASPRPALLLLLLALCGAALLLPQSVRAQTQQQQMMINTFIRAFEADRDGHWNSALVEYGRVLATQPNCDEAHWNLALGYDKRGQLDKALQHYAEVVRIHSDKSIATSKDGLQKLLKESHFISAMSNLGVAYTKADKPEEAADMFRTILQRDPSNARARSHLDVLRRPHTAAGAGEGGGRGAIPARPTFPSVRRLTAPELEADPELVSGARPFVLTGATVRAHSGSYRISPFGPVHPHR